MNPFNRERLETYQKYSMKLDELMYNRDPKFGRLLSSIVGSDNSPRHTSTRNSIIVSLQVNLTYGSNLIEGGLVLVT